MYFFVGCLFFYFIVFQVFFLHGIWSSLADLHDPFLKELSSKLETTVIASRAPVRIDAYRRAFLRWNRFATSSAEIQAFPSKPKFLALYLEYLLDTKQLLDEVEHDSENYQGRGLCYLPKPKAEADNTNRDLDNFAIMRKPNPIIVLLYNYKCRSVETFHRTTTK